MAEYKWNSVYEWFVDYMMYMEVDSLRKTIRILGRKVGDDTLQSIYESEMDADGFFEPLIEGVPLSIYDAYEAGWEAANGGKELSENPIPESLDESKYDSWCNGWWEYQEDNKPDD